MASSPVTDEPEDEVEFVSEGPIRPVLECIDLLSDEDDGSVSIPETIDDQIDRQKAQVESTLDRLALQVAVKKQERAEKCKAFREKMVSQQAHGLKELAFSQINGNDYDAKRCVDMWLKMPGLKPGLLNSDSRWRRRSAPHHTSNSSPHTCPVLNCDRIYENVPLLEGHLKRFDHSPCDPTIFLKGSPSALYACVACCRQFETKEAWQVHLISKASSASADGHISTLTCQLILCFACPACCLLFNIRDECLQHMAAKNHFSSFIRMSEKEASVTPIPIPRYAKNRLIALCKEVGFSVRCTMCKKVLGSHKEAQAHFNVNCRQGGAVAEAEKTVAQVMKQLRVLGQCSQCQKVFPDRVHIERHKQLIQHTVEEITSVEKSILHYCNYHEVLNLQRAAASAPSESASLQSASCKRDQEGDFTVGSPSKRKKVCLVPSATVGSWTVAWFCECGSSFSSEPAASKHLMAANMIFHMCGVCGKQMSQSSITRLHMSRFHGGAHLSNFHFWCQRCMVEIPKQNGFLSHVSEAHQGHSFYREQEVRADKPAPSAKAQAPSAKAQAPSATAAAGAPLAKPAWLCRMCEDLFESQAAVHQHCRQVSSHNFQRFICGHCPQRFFKEATLRRHCENEHGGQVEVRYFCGLCDSMQYDSEEDFLKHYESIHSQDYYCMEEAQANGPALSETVHKSPAEADQVCPCMGTEMGKTERNAAFTQCMKRLSRNGQCYYKCAPCGLQLSSYIRMKTHVQEKHKALTLKQCCEVRCVSCQGKHADVPTFHSHYHSQHCPLEPCSGCGVEGGRAEPNPLMLGAEEISPEVNAEEFEDVKRVIALSNEEAKKMTDCGRDNFEEDVKCALALSAEEASKQMEFDREMEEAVRRSLQEF